ncbi:MAG: hypothetical protein ACI4P4_12345 [Faecousia sp.]
MGQQLCAGAGIGVLRFPQDYFPSDGFSGVHDPMHAKALLLVRGQTRGAIVTLELPSIRPWELTDSLRAYAAELLRVPYENLWLVMTHDLAAPHVPGTGEGQKKHMAVLKTAVKEAAQAALAALTPVRALYCQGSCNVNANRDMHSAEGWWVGIHGSGPSDKTLSLIRFDDMSGKPAAALYSYSLKSSVLEGAVMSDGKRYASGDITGRANVKAEARMDCPVLFVMGAAGEQVPRQKANYLALDENRHFYSVNLAEAGYSILEALSDELADAICDADTVRELTPELSFDHFAFHADGQVSYPKTLPEPPVLHYDYIRTPGEDIPVWSIRIGSLVMLGVKPEIVTPVFDELRAASPFAHTLMATLVNGGQGYIAADTDYERFTYPGLKTPFFRGTDRVFLEQTEAFLKKLWEGAKRPC